MLLYSILSFNSCQETAKNTDNAGQDINQQEISQIEMDLVEAEETVKTLVPESGEESQLKADIEATEIKDANSESKLTEVSFDHSHWTDLLQKYVSDKGQVDYKAIKANASELRIYLDRLAGHRPDRSWSRAEKLTYWINAYNAFTVKLIIDKYPVKSIKDIKSPWDIRFIELGDKTFTLNHIEHKILRKMDEPRIHFAIVCASVSCPKLLNTAFEAAQLETQLSVATRDFCPIRKEIRSRKMTLRSPKFLNGLPRTLKRWQLD